MSSRMAWKTMVPVLLAGLVYWGCSSDNETTVVPNTSEKPHPPEFLIITDTNPTFLRLHWEDVNNNELGFRIERSLQQSGGFAEIDTVGQNITTYTDTVTAGGRYYYRVRSYTAQAISDPTETAWGDAVDNDTPATPTVVSPPNSELDVLPGAGLNWRGSDPNDDAIIYDVYLGNSLSLLKKVATTTDTFYNPADSLEINKSYFWRIKAMDPYGATGLSPVWRFAMQVDRVVVEQGYFIMGNTAINEHPGNPIRLNAFSMDKFEVTNQQFVNFLNETWERNLIRRVGGVVSDLAGVHVYCELNRQDTDTKIDFDTNRGIFYVEAGWEDHPVVEVTWHGAKAYCDFFHRQLPTEAQWEKAARGTGTAYGDTIIYITAGSDTVDIIQVGLGNPYPWGNTISSPYANYMSSGDPYESTIEVGTTPVGFYDGSTHGGFSTRNNASPYGIFDMGGNVLEWTADWEGPYSNPHSPPTTGQLKVIRGGSWRSLPGGLKTWLRNATFPDSTDNAIGFRTVGSP
ncbi:MAG: SUMF1/EgtB/PvdO family nonheme iron enzyme [Candidatus Eisenbacteria bacterium]|uniref:SUMF1/EgtB/PvdO family nonheme iron enzyme n=1 Tax=Eiseniibacteriota bacterium TaxID=2212470 RepID=A0A948W5A2_UNCEI|nr:SUMF1/EgtB/PvdO family nonheme iron enzyme [Candidatus Eisenbacteria bacterium]MBU1951122.1 SUMF1/EgtB/PvdO family nonheme iron enzyme [Candidatus Eisenbacteria bacterium]MBU2689800.1 SUMF1/EgtB/PvdO family nonheme iron enzyme [Candidatus Eisenbacteria bacterium]